MTLEALTHNEAMRAFERQYLLNVLTASRWNMRAAARLAGIPRPRLYRRMWALGLKRPAHV